MLVLECVGVGQPLEVERRLELVPLLELVQRVEPVGAVVVVVGAVAPVQLQHE